MRPNDVGQRSPVQWKAVGSFLGSVLLLAIGVVFVLGLDPQRMRDAIAASDGRLIAAAVIVHFLGFPARGVRWTVLLRGIGVRIGWRDATTAIVASWFVNSLVPAKLGDLYRVYLVKARCAGAFAPVLATVVVERLVDLLCVAVVIVGVGLFSLHAMTDSIVLIGGVTIAIVGFAAIFLRSWRRFAILPLPRRIEGVLDRFFDGARSTIDRRSIPVVALLTGCAWASEIGRLYLVIHAVGGEAATVGIDGAAVIALVGSLLTAVPFTPAGLGLTDAGLFGLLTVGYGVSPTMAAAITIIDRAISVVLVVAVGGLLALVSPVAHRSATNESPSVDVVADVTADRHHVGVSRLDGRRRRRDGAPSSLTL
jgi:uncharacterized protein (TIRG00374 family)